MAVNGKVNPYEVFGLEVYNQLYREARRVGFNIGETRRYLEIRAKKYIIERIERLVTGKDRSISVLFENLIPSDFVIRDIEGVRSFN